MDATAEMKKTIAERKKILGEKLTAVYERNKKLITNHDRQRVKQRRTE